MLLTLGPELNQFLFEYCFKNIIFERQKVGLKKISVISALVSWERMTIAHGKSGYVTICGSH